LVVKKKDRKVEVRLDPDLHDQAHRYVEERGVTLGALIRALLRLWTDPEMPHELPPGVEEEKKRPSRRKGE
jgi:antitoxin component of RelBE/YafQ-DinJ toxin-antitoxin module